MPPLKALFWHGYGLAHTGSNVYAAAICDELTKLGCDVVLVCQERRPQGRAKRLRRYVPEIGKILPVYVLDSYEHHTPKRFLDLSPKELRDYVTLNRKALTEILDKERPDVVHVNHAVVGPFIAAPVCREFGVPMVVTVQGSDMLFAAGRSTLYRRLARLGLQQAASVVVLSRYGAEQAKTVLQSPAWIDKKLRVINAGVDCAVFKPQDKAAATSRLLASYEEFIVDHPGGVDRSEQLALASRIVGVDGRLGSRLKGRFSIRAPDSDAAVKVREAELSEHTVIAFVGNLMATKGAQYLVAAAPLLLHANPDAVIVISGFGRSRAYIEGLLAAIHAGDLPLCRRLAAALDEQLGSERPEIGLERFFELLDGDGLRDYFLSGSRQDLRRRVVFTGMIEHNQVKHLLALADVAVVPGVMPESFGIVAVEAMACGAPTVVARQSALAELADWQAGVLGAAVGSIAPGLGPHFVNDLAEAIDNLAQAAGRTSDSRTALAGAVFESYSWSSVAGKLLRFYRELLGGHDGKVRKAG